MAQVESMQGRASHLVQVLPWENGEFEVGTARDVDKAPERKHPLQLGRWSRSRPPPVNRPGKSDQHDRQVFGDGTWTRCPLRVEWTASPLPR